MATTLSKLEIEKIISVILSEVKDLDSSVASLPQNDNFYLTYGRTPAYGRCRRV